MAPFNEWYDVDARVRFMHAHAFGTYARKTAESAYSMGWTGCC